MLLSLAERRLGITEGLAGQIAGPRDPAHVTPTVEDVLRARIFAIACGYPGDNDSNWLRPDPAFKLACGRLPVQGTCFLHRAFRTIYLRDREAACRRVGWAGF
jgi:hypothetical protein